MRTIHLLFASLIAVGTGSTAQAADDEPAIDAKPQTLVRAPTTTVMRVGDETVRITPMRYEARTRFGVKFVCALELETEQSSAMLPVVGVGDTETVSCDRILAIAPVVSDRVGMKIVVESYARSPNAAGRGVSIISRSQAGDFFVDDELTDEATGRGELPSLDDVIAKLR